MNICIFGDSIAWGAHDPERGGWVNHLRNYIEASGLDFKVYNLGVSANTTNDILKRFEAEAKARQAFLIVFAIGINDTLLLKSNNQTLVSEAEFRNNLTRLFELALKITNKIIFIGLTPVDESKTTPVSWDKDKYYTNGGIERFNNIIKNFCTSNKLKFIEILDLLKPEDLTDGLHPNTDGHKKIFTKIQPEIETFLSL
jgi:lysophospholipase L1-like esterase